MAKVNMRRKRRGAGNDAKLFYRGMDLGDQPRFAALANTEFRDALVRANVIGCAYGLDYIDGSRQQVPVISLVGTNPEGLVDAFHQFEQWGCIEDGDAVDISILLKKDGTYDLWVGPEVHRLFYRTLPNAGLHRSLALNVSWIKRLDSTHEMVRDLKNYCATAFHPVKFLAATCDPARTTPQGMRTVQGWKGFVKFDLRVLDENDHPDDPRFQFDAPARKRDIPNEPDISPSDLSRLRERTLDIAFPVSRERVRRSNLLANVRAITGFDLVKEVQVVQAVINLMLSDYLHKGDRHYGRIKGDWKRSLWQAVMNHAERADGETQLSDQIPEVVAKQIELDVEYALGSQHLTIRDVPFKERQIMFLSMGFVDE
ncbi:hypothetical protein FAZ95_07465 [Trinickia violacea]|uniref:Uncharacterized protein n=1 Tax=Trinickia violacea TaxID=2571746 RepID=A0A4P8IJR0_9BURK|nr:hypothetical protein [Trinickia violacea]QCP49038.1 hypothetical protein FAZ95_07465 [Trinickia violacea]